MYVQYIQGTVSTLGHYSLQPTMYNIYTVKVPNLIIPMPKNPPTPPPGIEINPRKKRKKNKTKQNFFFFGIKNYNNKIPSSYQRPRGKFFKTWFQFLGKFFFSFSFSFPCLVLAFFSFFSFFPFSFRWRRLSFVHPRLGFPKRPFLGAGREDRYERMKKRSLSNEAGAVREGGRKCLI